MASSVTAGISRIAYRLPSRRLGLPALERDGHIASARALRDLGFGGCYVLEDPGGLEELLVGAGDDALATIARDQVDAVLLYSGLGGWGTPRHRSTLARFRYPAARIADRLGLAQAAPLGLSQQGCSGLLASIDLAASLVRSSDRRAILCLAADALGNGSSREVMHSLMSDAAAALLVERDGSRNQIVRFHQVAAPAYWDTPRKRDELIAAYFPLAKRAILETLEGAGLALGDVRWFVPSNVGIVSWRILGDLLAVRDERIWLENVARVGHTVSCDNAINLADMERRGALRRGDLVLLFTFGFGATWTSLLLRH